MARRDMVEGPVRRFRLAPPPLSFAEQFPSPLLRNREEGVGADALHSAASLNAMPRTSSSEQRCIVGLLRQMALVRKKSAIG